MKSFAHFFQNLTLAKKTFLAITPLISMLISIKAALIGLFILITIDLLTGIKKNLHKDKVPFNPFKKLFWKSIKSYALRQTWRKTYEYGIGILVVLVFEALVLGSTPIALLGKTFSITELSVLLPAAIEVWSIFENMEAVTGMNLLKRLKPLLPKPLQNLLNANK
ncbi:phage holin family protein [Flagellimonas onchidii]|uniref:phage holin family protein n=1 Tax=Flagellimonas onchidii TaxID=2562684 RepID=UPI0010A6318E|nr:phage holin family protein [Allomuricauda onchidii]